MSRNADSPNGDETGEAICAWFCSGREVGSGALSDTNMDGRNGVTYNRVGCFGSKSPCVGNEDRISQNTS